MIHGHPPAARTRTASGTASASPPTCPRVAIERMNTPSSVACSCIRRRSPRIEPPVNGEVGSTASTATRSPPSRATRSRALVNVLLPAPGAPVMPTTYAAPSSAGASAVPRSTCDSNRANAVRSPAATGGRSVNVDDLGDPVDAVTHDPLDAGLQRLGAGRTRPARADELDGDDATGLVHVLQLDVATVGLQGRADDLDRLFDLGAHATSIQPAPSLR